MIETKDLAKAYSGQEALANVDINVEQGSIYGLVGSNGAGKTTLIKLLAGIYRQDTGEVRLDGQAVFENVSMKERVAYLADTPYFPPQYTMEKMARHHKVLYPKWSQQRFEKLAQNFDLDLNKRISHLSKGMQRQAAFMLAFSCMPDIMLLDEPFDGLDAVVRQKIRNMIVQEVAERQVTVLISSHNLKELESLCDTIGILHKGRLLMERDLDDLKSDAYKIQVVFQKEFDASSLKDLRIMHEEIKGSIRQYVVEGNREQIEQQFRQYEPVVLDILPLTLDELFIYEMEEVGYEIKNIIL